MTLAIVQQDNKEKSAIELGFESEGGFDETIKDSIP